MARDEVTAEELRRRVEEKRKALDISSRADTTISLSADLSLGELRDEPEWCPQCRVRPAIVVSIYGKLSVLPCEECRGAERDEEVIAAEAKQRADREAKLRENLEAIGVNVRRYFDQEPATFDAFNPDPDRHALSACEVFVEAYKQGQRPSLYLFGQREGSPLAPGNGKTLLSVAVLRELARDPAVRIKDLRFVFVPELLLEIQDTFDNPARSMRDVVNYYTSPELLVWDDFGAEKLSDFAVRTLYTILYKREGRSNIFTSNLSVSQVADRDPYAERITSRIVGDAQLVRLRGPDRREQRRMKLVQGGRP